VHLNRPVLSSTTRAALALAAGLTGAGVLAAPAASAAGSDDLARLRGCESGGDYAADTGNGYYGAYQFDLSTWHALGLSGLPSQASPATQDNAVMRLAAERGWSPWPSCSAELGLSGVPSAAWTPSYGRAGASAPLPAAAIGAAVAAEAPVLPVAAPPEPADVLTTAAGDAARDDVRAWQQRMADRGWPVTVDGLFGPQTQTAAAAFAAEKSIVEGLPGEVGPQVWAAAWTLPVD